MLAFRNTYELFYIFYALFWHGGRLKSIFIYAYNMGGLEKVLFAGKVDLPRERRTTKLGAVSSPREGGDLRVVILDNLRWMPPIC